MTSSSSDEDARLVSIFVRRYKRRCWWASTEDLTQEGWLALTTARPNFDPRVGLPWSTYAARVLILAMRRHLWNESSPVSGGKHRPRESYTGALRAPLETLDIWPEAVPQLDDLLADARWRQDVRCSLAMLACDVLPGREAAAALAVTLEEKTHAQVIEDEQMSVQRLYAAIHRLRAEAAQDAALFDLSQER